MKGKAQPKPANTTSFSPAPCNAMQVLDWLEDELELGEYRREFARAKVDGALLLNLEVGSLTAIMSEHVRGYALACRAIEQQSHCCRA